MCWYDDLCSCTDEDLAPVTPTPMDEGMDFELGAACDLNDTECEACQ